MLRGTVCEEWDVGRTNSFLTWIPSLVLSVFLHRCGLISSKLFRHPSWWMKSSSWHEVGIFDARGSFYFDDKKKEEQEVKIRKGGKLIRATSWMQPAKRKRRGIRIRSDRGKSVSVPVPRSVFLFLFLQFLLNCGILACCQWVHQSFSHTADWFIEKWVRQANSKMHKKEGKEEGQCAANGQHGGQDRGQWDGMRK